MLASKLNISLFSLIRVETRAFLFRLDVQQCHVCYVILGRNNICVFDSLIIVIVVKTCFGQMQNKGSYVKFCILR